MIVNGTALLAAAPITEMFHEKLNKGGVSYGLTEVGYDIRIKQGVTFYPGTSLVLGGGVRQGVCHHVIEVDGQQKTNIGNFLLASSIEHFALPNDLCGVVHDKSTWARHGLSVFNTVIEPGWRGFLTLELVYNGRNELHIPAGSGIAQVIFHKIAQPAAYEGKYQDQANKPVPPSFGKNPV